MTARNEGKNVTIKLVQKGLASGNPCIASKTLTGKHRGVAQNKVSSGTPRRAARGLQHRQSATNTDKVLQLAQGTS